MLPSPEDSLSLFLACLLSFLFIKASLSSAEMAWGMLNAHECSSSLSQESICCCFSACVEEGLCRLWWRLELSDYVLCKYSCTGGCRRSYEFWHDRQNYPTYSLCVLECIEGRSSPSAWNPPKHPSRPKFISRLDLSRNGSLGPTAVNSAHVDSSKQHPIHPTVWLPGCRHFSM